MFRFFRKHRSIVMGAMAACIAGVILFGVGGSSFTPSKHDAVIKINGTKISQIEYDRILNQLMRQHKEATTPQERAQMQGQALNELIREEVFYQQSQKYGIVVTDQELQMQLKSIPAFQKNGQFDPQTYVRVVTQMFSMTPQDFEKSHQKDIAGREVNQLIATSIHISDLELQEELDKRIKAETDSKKRKEMQANPETVREDMLNQQTNLVFGDWLNQLNSTLKISFVSEPFRKSLQQPSAANPQ